MFYKQQQQQRTIPKTCDWEQDHDEDYFKVD